MRGNVSTLIWAFPQVSKVDKRAENWYPRFPFVYLVKLRRIWIRKLIKCFFSLCSKIVAPLSEHYCNSKGTRLEILSRPKAPKILQELPSNSEKLLSPRPTKLLKDSKRIQRIPKESKGFQKIPKESKGFQRSSTDSKRFQKIPKDSNRNLKVNATSEVQVT